MFWRRLVPVVPRSSAGSPTLASVLLMVVDFMLLGPRRGVSMNAAVEIYVDGPA